MKPLPEYRIVNGVLRLRSGAEGTAWPWPFREDDGPAWRARYAPEQLTHADLMELASIADTYHTLIAHPSRSVRENLFVLHRIFEVEATALSSTRAKGDE